MILYAEVASERASKGQGGNEFLETTFKVRNKVVGYIELYLFDDDIKHGCNENEWVLKFKKLFNDDWEILAQGHIKAKGVKLKGERHCDDCAMDVPSDKHHNCEVCGKRTT